MVGCTVPLTRWSNSSTFDALAELQAVQSLFLTHLVNGTVSAWLLFTCSGVGGGMSGLAQCLQQQPRHVNAQASLPVGSGSCMQLQEAGLDQNSIRL